MWKIRSTTKTDNHGKPQYWSKEFGWTWKEMGDEFTDVEKLTLPMIVSGGVWEECV